ncbi:MAG: hypothetical protein U0872_10280 [Planctomycetaceae bacterium]
MSLAVRPHRSWLRLFAFWRPPFNRGRILLTGLLLSVCLISTYFFFYGTLLRGQEQAAAIDFDSQQIVVTTLPFYSFQKSLAPAHSWWLEVFFEPAHRIDRWIRQDQWPSPYTVHQTTSATFDQPQ